MKLMRVVLGLLVLGALAVPIRAGAQAAVSRFEPASCQFTIDSAYKEGKDVRCGFLIVPENRILNNGKTIKLAVAIFKSQSVHPQPDPVIFLNGGPGGSTVQILG